MTRPFSNTMQAHRLDLHRLWLVLLAIAILMALLWLPWAFTDTLLDKDSIHVEVSSQVSDATTIEPHGNVSRPSVRRHRWLKARFPATSHGGLMPGTEVAVSLRGHPGAQTLAGVVTEVNPINPDREQVLIELRVTVPTDAVDPLESTPPQRVRLAFRMGKPIYFLLPELAPTSRSPAPDPIQTRE